MNHNENISSSIERILYPCSEVNCCDYETFPLATYEELSMMETEFANYSSKIHIFPFVRESCKGSKYIEIYVWDTMLYPDLFERFVIVEGCRLSEEKENDFLHYIESFDYSLNHEEITEHFFLGVKKAFPQIQFKETKPYLIRKAFMYIYYATHCGVREILYKAGLDNIAFHLGGIVSRYNILGKNPEEIIGLPLRLLRILNQRHFIYSVYNEEKFEVLKGTFEKFSGYIGKSDYISKGQWMYLEQIYLPEGMFYGCKFNRTLYKRLSEFGSEYTLESYREFFELKKELPEIKRMKLPKSGSVEDIVNRLRVIYEYKNGKTEVNNLCVKRRIKERCTYEYHGQKLSVIMPNESFDLCIESFTQKNCIIEYIKRHAKSETTILFIRRNNDMDKAYITMEVGNDRCIRQVYGKSNSIPPKEIFAFLEEYAIVKNLKYSPRMLLASYTSTDDCPYYIELTEYVMDYEKRCKRATMEWKYDDIDYEQINLKDIIPEIL